ncbi:MAG: hypothetical protein G01um101416_294 [Microgenomates group bacterium Gr01-1014_16]|nr:MAG: hypothetical protein G01um101416_294 [Microgenomates group bacterium Gr01-1014_16]
MSGLDGILKEFQDTAKVVDQLGEFVLDNIMVAADLVKDPRVSPWTKGLLGAAASGAMYFIVSKIPEEGIIPDGVFVFRGVDAGALDNGLVSKSLATAVLGAVSIWALQKVANPIAVDEAWEKRKAVKEARTMGFSGSGVDLTQGKSPVTDKVSSETNWMVKE